MFGPADQCESSALALSRYLRRYEEGTGRHLSEGLADAAGHQRGCIFIAAQSEAVVGFDPDPVAVVGVPENGSVAVLIMMGLPRGAVREGDGRITDFERLCFHPAASGATYVNVLAKEG